MARERRTSATDRVSRRLLVVTARSGDRAELLQRAEGALALGEDACRGAHEAGSVWGFTRRGVARPDAFAETWLLRNGDTSWLVIDRDRSRGSQTRSLLWPNDVSKGYCLGLNNLL